MINLHMHRVNRFPCTQQRCRPNCVTAYEQRNTLHLLHRLVWE